MLRSFVCAVLAFAFLGSTAIAQAGDMPATEPRTSTLEHSGDGASLLLAQWGGGYTVCCKRGWRDWWTSRRSCNRAGGYVVSGRHCRNDGWRGDRRDNWRRGNWRDDDRRGRVCCKRGHRDWWTNSYRSCRRQGGYVTSNRQCRWG